MPTKTKAPIPENMIEMGRQAVKTLRREVTIGLCPSTDIARTVLESAHVGELVAALENLLAHCETYFNIGEVGGKEAEIAEAARTAIAKIKGE